MINKIQDACGSVGYTCLRFLSQIGNFFIFCITALFWAIRPPWYFKQIFSQIIDIGFYSLPVVGLTTFFSGMVLALQTYSGFSEFNSESTVARVVLTSITRELGPVLTGLMVAGRVGAKMAAEIPTKAGRGRQPTSLHNETSSEGLTQLQVHGKPASGSAGKLPVAVHA